MRIKFAEIAATPCDQVLFELWERLSDLEVQLEESWSAVDRVEEYLANVDCLASAADAIGHEHDRVVQQIAAQPASSWEGVAIKLLTWRRTANLSEFNQPDADTALAFSVYLDALRLCPGALGVANDAAIARLALRHPDSAGE